MVYFTSDQHFFHMNAIDMCERPFDDLEEMHKTLIDNWNSTVGKSDEIYLLGDFVFRGSGSQANEILRQLNGKKYLIKGNHERYLKDSEFNISAFEWIKDYYVLSYKDMRFILFHYPILEWEHFHRKTIHLYGHIHSKKFWHPQYRAINVGVDNNYFYPVSADELYARIFPK